MTEGTVERADLDCFMRQTTMSPELTQLLEFYRRFLSDHALSMRYQGRKIVYDCLRQALVNWEAANSKTIKDALDAEDNAFAGRDTTADWLQP